MSEGFAVFTAAKASSAEYCASGPGLDPPPDEIFLACGRSHAQNSRLRPTKFSHMRLWLSWMPSEMDCASGVPK